MKRSSFITALAVALAIIFSASFCGATLGAITAEMMRQPKDVSVVVGGVLGAGLALQFLLPGLARSWKRNVFRR